MALMKKEFKDFMMWLKHDIRASPKDRYANQPQQGAKDYSVRVADNKDLMKVQIRSRNPG